MRGGDEVAHRVAVVGEVVLGEGVQDTGEAARGEIVEVDPREPISDELLRRFAFAGTPDEIAEQAEALFAAGATRVEFGTPHGLDERRGVELLGEIVRLSEPGRPAPR